MKKKLVIVLAAVLGIALLVAGVVAATTITLPNGANLSVTITDPVSNTQVLADGAPATVAVAGTASIGLGTPDATLVYVFDSSGSTAGSGGACATIAACEKTFFKALNAAAIADGSVDKVGLAVYGANGVTADMSPAGGDQLLTDPEAGPGDVNTVVDSIVLTNENFNFDVGQFTAKTGNDADGTNFTVGLILAKTIVDASLNGTKIVVFASDGLSNQGGGGFAAAQAALAGTGAKVFSIAIGAGSSCSGGTDGTLNEVAANGGTCTEVSDPNNLPSIIPNLIGSTLVRLEKNVDAGTFTQIPNSEINPDLPLPGAASVTYGTSVAGLNPGSHGICVTAVGTIATTGSTEYAATECITVLVYDLVLTPASESNNLGAGDNTHTVTAILQGPPGSVAGYLVSFAVGGTNAGAVGVCAPVSCQTDASGKVTFTYTVPVALSSLGTDTITAKVTLANPDGEIDTEEVKKEWVDTTPPVPACLETVNPAGNKVPPAGSTTLPGPKGGQNEDGFYELLAKDLVDPDPDIFVRDGGSGTVFGPFASGTRIKYTQDPSATPSQKTIGGPSSAVSWHIIGTGDAQVYAVDSSGNTSNRVSCLVPPPPK